MSYFKAIVQDVRPDPLNTFEYVTIAAGATYNSAGTGSSTLGVNAIQIAAKSTQPLIIYVDQGDEDDEFIITDEYEYNPTKPFGITVQAISAYVRVRVKNVGDAEDDAVDVDTVLCPIVEALPRSLDRHGNLKVGITHFEDAWGNNVKVTPVGALQTVTPFKVVGVPFGAGSDASFWTLAAGGTAATSAIAASICLLTGGTASGGYSTVNSVRAARFVLGAPNVFRAIIRVPTVVVAATVRRWGAYSGAGGPPPVPVDGFFFQLSAAGVLSVNCFSGGAASYASVASGSFNGDVTHYTVDQNQHVYEIIYYLGKVSFFIDDILIHSVRATTAILSGTFTLPCRAAVVNTGVSGGGTLEVWVMTLIKLGTERTAPLTKYYHGVTANTVVKAGAGTLRGIAINGWDDTTIITLYDSLTTTNILAILNPNSGVQGALIPFYIPYEIDFYTGLAITIASAATDVTVVVE